MQPTDPPEKRAGLLNSRKVRNKIVDNDWNSDGFWVYGYGNDPKRRRHIRHVEKQRLKRQIEEDR